MDSKTSLGAGVRPLQGGGGIFKSAAVAVLRMERRLMTTGEITKVALEKVLINCQGRTPEATMASALYTDVKRKLGNSVFTRPQEGLFGLREWEDEGFIPEPAIALPSPSSTPVAPMLGCSNRLRSSSAREQVIKKPERFAAGDFEDMDEVLSRSTPSPLLHMEQHTGVGPLNLPEGSLMDLSAAPRRESGSTFLGDARKSGSLDGWKEVEASASNCSTLSGSEEAHLRRAQLQLSLPCDGRWAASSESSPVAKYDRLAVLHNAAWTAGGGEMPEATLEQAPLPLLDSLPAAALASLAYAAEHESPKKKPRLTLDIPCEGAPPSELHITSGEHGMPIYAALQTPTFPLTHSVPPSCPLSPQLVGGSRPDSALLAWRGGSLGAHLPSGLGSLSAQMPTGLGSASAAMVLDTPGLMQLALPEGDLSFSPLKPLDQLFGEEAVGQPLGRTASSAAAALRAHAPERLIHANPDQGDASFAPAAAMAVPSSLALLAPLPWAPMPHTAAAEYAATTSTAVEGGNASTWERLKQMEDEVRRQEALLGENHPQVGKQWLYLSRAYQNEDPRQYSEKAERALVRAWRICSTCFNKCRKPPPCDAPFDFLLSRIRTTTTAATAAQGPQHEAGGFGAMIPIQQAAEEAGIANPHISNNFILAGTSAASGFPMLPLYPQQEQILYQPIQGQEARMGIQAGDVEFGSLAATD